MYSPFVAKLVQFKQALAIMDINSDFNWCLNLKSILDYEYGKNKWQMKITNSHEMYKVVPYQFTFISEYRKFKELHEIDEYCLNNLTKIVSKYYNVAPTEGMVGDLDQLETLFQCNPNSKIFKQILPGKQYNQVYNVSKREIEETDSENEMNMFLTADINLVKADNVSFKISGTLTQQQPSFAFENNLETLDTENVYNYLNNNLPNPKNKKVEKEKTEHENDDLVNVLDLSNLIRDINYELDVMQNKQENVYNDFYNSVILKITENVALQHFLAYPYYYIPSRHYSICKNLRNIYDIFLPDSCFIINIEKLNDYLSLLDVKMGFKMFCQYYNYMVKLSVGKGNKFANILQSQQTKYGKYYTHITALYILYHSSIDIYSEEFTMII
jgi:hypothetical protein